MKLGDLIDALAEEIEIVRPELNQYLEELSSHDKDDETFIDAADAYADQIERMGEAAEMVGFPGLQHACEHVVNNITSFQESSEEKRDEYIDFLSKWPDLIVNYLKNMEDTSCAAGMIDYLKAAPLPLSSEQALKIMHDLGAFPSGMDSIEDDSQPKRPVLACPDDANLTVPDDVDPGLLEGFYQEAPGQTDELVNLLNDMVSGRGNMSDLISAKRIVHTLKGTGAIIGLSAIANLGHHFEDILDYFESKDGQVNNKIATVLLDGGHCLAQMIAYLTGDDDYPQQTLSVLQNVIDIANIIDRGGDLDNIYLRNQTVSGAGATQQSLPERKETAVNTGTSSTGALRVSMKRIDELFRVSAEISVNTAAMESQIKEMSAFTKQLRTQQLRVKKRLFELETIIDVRSLALMHSKTNDADADFDPLELEQYNELHSTTHALLEEFNDIIILSDQLTDNFSGLNSQESQQQVLSSDLQHLVIGTRMAEVGTLESRLQRNIRTTCQMTGKQARLELIGGDTLMDSDVLSQFADPLLHLLRNAIDHGIESMEEREAMGKDPVGTVKLHFSSQGQQIILRCEDDGHGLNYERILQKAIDNNIVNKDDNLTDDEIGQLIFSSGFSTRESVSQVSGRGVGMDVVRNWLSTINGTISISSVADTYTSMLLSFPSSLTTVQSLIVKSSGQAFALPSIHIQQALAKDEGEFIESGDALQYHHNDIVYAAKHLSDLLGFERKVQLENTFSVLIRIKNEIWAIAVDDLIDSRELLLKSPGVYIRHIPSVMGTSILGDGSVAIHLDIQKLVESSEGRVRQVLTSASDTNEIKMSDVPNILIVDDSLSVRNTLQSLVGDAGFNVKIARDGIEAVNLMETFTPQVVVTDLEMPNMNGIELTSHIRNRNDFQNVPIIMITSRSQDKHRELAAQAGVTSYLTKPYNDAQVLLAISKSITVH